MDRSGMDIEFKVAGANQGPPKPDTWWIVIRICSAVSLFFPSNHLLLSHDACQGSLAVFWQAKRVFQYIQDGAPEPESPKNIEKLYPKFQNP